MIKNFFSKSKNNSLIIITITLFFTSLGFLNHKLIIQNYGPKTFEFYSIVVSLSALLSNFFMVGSRSTFLKLRSEKNRLIDFLVPSFFIIVFLSGLSGLFLNYVLINFSDKLLKSYSLELQIFILLQALIFLFSYFFNSIDKTILSKIVLLSPISFLTFFLNIFVGVEIVNLLIYALILPIAFSIPLIFKYICKSFNVMAFNYDFFKKNLFYGLNHMSSNVIDALSNKMNIIFLTFIISNLHEMATYAIALSISKISSTFSNSINHVYSPQIADSIFLKDIKNDHSFSEMKNFNIKISLIFLFVFIALGGYAIEFFYSNIYYEAYQISIILLIGQFFNSYFNPKILSLKLSGHAYQMSLIKLLALIISLLINLYVYKYFGLFSVAISFVICINILFNFFVVKIFNFSRNHS